MWFWNVGVSYGKPVGVYRLLLLVGTFKTADYIRHLVCTDGSTTQTVPGQRANYLQIHKQM